MVVRNQQLVILGGGPAGAISAILARQDDINVTLIAPARCPPRLEGLSPRLHQWLDRQKLLKGFSGITGPLSRQVDWSGISESNLEFVVERAALDAHLQAHAEAMGATRLTTYARIEGHQVVLDGGARLHPDGIIDARGRAARRTAPGGWPATLALCGWLHARVPPSPGIRITALPQGWLWRVALADGRIWAQFVTDAASPAPNPDPAPARLLAAVALAEPDLRDLALSGDLTAREAAPRLPMPMSRADLRCLPVGDALAAMDPLSGHGQFWAVSSALAVAAVRRTLAADPDRADLCRRFLDQRAAETALRMARIGRDFLRHEGRFANAPFWAARRDLPDTLPAHPAAPDFRIASAPLIEQGLIVQAEVLITPRSPGGVGWFGRIPAARAYRLSLHGDAALHHSYGPAAPALIAALQAEAVAPA